MWADHFFEDTPFINTGNKDVDGYFTVVSTLLIMGAAGSVIWNLSDAWFEAKRDWRRGRARRFPQREVQGFLALAIISLLVVILLRFEHRRLKLLSWDTIEDWRLEHPGLPVLGKEPPSVAGLAYEKAKAAAKA
jgi:hypothetical protein